MAGCGIALFPVHSQVAPGPLPVVAADDPIRHCMGVQLTVPPPPPVPRTVEQDLRYANEVRKIALALSMNLRSCNAKRAEAIRRMDNAAYVVTPTHESVRSQ